MVIRPGNPDLANGGLLRSLDRLGAARPDIVLMAPYMTYLVLLGVVALVPPEWRPAVIVLRGVASLAVVWAFRRHLPPWGRPHWLIAIVGGAVVGWGWVAGQYASDALGLPRQFPLYPGGGAAAADPRILLGADDLFWTTWTLRLVVAITVVPMVEELFWRVFLLRALIDWNHFERVPLGTFTWGSFLGTAALSVLQHPGNWVVSVLCWMAFNAVFYRTRSVLCLVLLHGFTNLVLYLIVLRTGDWSFIW